jgi:3-hydroxy acid dehydrogenase/malonic semialdehyde reductase
MKLENAVCVVTGATSGIGASCARLLVERGARVIAAGRRAERLTTGQPLPLDVRDRAAVEAALGDLEVDVLVNAAGLALGLERAHEASTDDWERMIDTNCKGLVHCTRAVLPGMVRRKRGHVVHIGSVASIYPYPAGNVYGATKAFVRQFSQGMKADLAGTGVRVTNIEPGMCETEFSLVRFGGDEARARKVYEGMQPLTGDDVAEVVLFCLERPPHVNINIVELMPTAQGFGPFTVHRA